MAGESLIKDYPAAMYIIRKDENQKVAVTDKERKYVWKILKKFFTLLP
jgi:FMN phosphatase YigB (HAD superfamily)